MKTFRRDFTNAPTRTNLFNTRLTVNGLTFASAAISSLVAVISTLLRRAGQQVGQSIEMVGEVSQDNA